MWLKYGLYCGEGTWWDSVGAELHGAYKARVRKWYERMAVQND